MSQERTEQATGLMHLLRSAFPSAHLPPWMSVHRTRMLAIIAEEKTAGKIAEVLERQTYLHSLDEEDREGALEDGEELIMDANEMFAKCLDIDAQVTHDLAPSEGGLGRRQAMSGVNAQKTGSYTEPKNRSFTDKLRRRNKPEQQVSGGVE